MDEHVPIDDEPPGVFIGTPRRQQPSYASPEHLAKLMQWLYSATNKGKGITITSWMNPSWFHLVWTVVLANEMNRCLPYAP